MTAFICLWLCVLPSGSVIMPQLVGFWASFWILSSHSMSPPPWEQLWKRRVDNFFLIIKMVLILLYLSFCALNKNKLFKLTQVCHQAPASFLQVHWCCLLVFHLTWCCHHLDYRYSFLSKICSSRMKNWQKIWTNIKICGW